MYNTSIDLSFIFYKSFHITKAYYNTEIDLTKQDDRGYLIRKTTTDLCKVVRELNSDKIFIACDDLSFRKSLFEGYKNRGEKEPGFRDTENKLKEIYTQKGLNILQVPNLEADDIMALTHKKLKGETHMIVTGDEDLRQLLDSKTFVYNPDSKKKTFFYKDDSQLRYKPKEGPDYTYTKVDPNYVLFTKIVKGCSTDHVPQITPKCYRTTKLDLIYNEFIQKFGVEGFQFTGKSERGLYSLLSSAFPLDNLVFLQQLYLVTLQERFMPFESVETFDEIFVNKTSEVVWEMKEILKDSPYIDTEFNS